MLSICSEPRHSSLFSIEKKTSVFLSSKSSKSILKIFDQNITGYLVLSLIRNSLNGVLELETSSGKFSNADVVVF